MAETLRIPTNGLRIPGAEGFRVLKSRFGGLLTSYMHPAQEPVVSHEPVILTQIAEPAISSPAVSPNAQGLDLIVAIQKSRDGRTFKPDFNWRRLAGIYDSFTIEDEGVQFDVGLCKGDTIVITNLSTLENTERPLTGEELRRLREKRISKPPVSMVGQKIPDPY